MPVVAGYIRIFRNYAKKKTFMRAVFAAWVFLWALFLIRGLVKGELAEYKALWGLNLREKRAYVTGTEFYEFLNFCKKNIPAGSDFMVRAEYDTSLGYFWAPYHLYPLTRNIRNPEYIICYKSEYEKEGYELAVRLGRDKYILKLKK